VSAPDLDDWLPDPAVRVAHRRAAEVAPGALWAAAQHVRLDDTRRLGQLVRWRIPGLPEGLAYLDLFRNPPFLVLDERHDGLVSCLCGRIWTLRRDYPVLADARAFLDFAEPGTVRVLFANRVVATQGGAAILSETRVAAIDRGGRFGLMAVRPLISAFHGLIASEALAAVVRAAERDSGPS
jgi:hypothetical protein